MLIPRVYETANVLLIFLDSYRFLQTRLSQLPQHFSLRYPKQYFCYTFLTFATMNYVANHLPPLQHYFSFHDTAAIKAEKADYHSKHFHSPFVMTTVLFEYLDTDCRLLAYSVCLLNLQCFNLQKISLYREAKIVIFFMNVFLSHFSEI